MILTDLTGANMAGAHLNQAHLSFVNLKSANLSNALLLSAELNDADLGGANLTNAKNWTNQQLAQAKHLDRTIMPDGTVMTREAEQEFKKLYRQ